MLLYILNRYSWWVFLQFLCNGVKVRENLRPDLPFFGKIASLSNGFLSLIVGRRSEERIITSEVTIISF